MNNVHLSGVTVGGDLSGSQWKAVEISSTDREIAAITNSNAPQVPIGILQDDPKSDGDPADVVILGQTKMEYGGNITAGDNIAVNDNGEAISDAEVTAQDGADIYHIGVALETGVDNDIREVVILHFGLIGKE